LRSLHHLKKSIQKHPAPQPIRTPLDLFPGALHNGVGSRVDMGGGKTI